VIVLSSLASAPPADACDCIDGGPFLKVAPKADLVVLAKVLRHEDMIEYKSDKARFPTAMVLEVQQVFGGKERRKRVKVFGDRGADCLEYVTRFPVKTRLFFALHRAKGHRFDKRGRDGGHYEISSCGTFFARVSKGAVTVTSGRKRHKLKVEKFITRLTSAISKAR
jgi:hypothetical protein